MSAMSGKLRVLGIQTATQADYSSSSADGGGGGGGREQAVLTLAAAVEAATRHPLADAVLAEARRRGLAAPPAAEAAATVAGRGVKARVDGVWVAVGRREWALEAVTGGAAGAGAAGAAADVAMTAPPADASVAGASSVWVAVEGQGLVGRIWLRDTLRPDAAATVAALKAAGKQVRCVGGGGGAGEWVRMCWGTCACVDGWGVSRSGHGQGEGRGRGRVWRGQGDMACCGHKGHGPCAIRTAHVT